VWAVAHNLFIPAKNLPQSSQFGWIGVSPSSVIAFWSGPHFSIVLAPAPTPKTHSPSHSRAAKRQIAKHDLIHNFSQCSRLTTTCNPAAQAARIPSTYANRVGLTTFPFQTYKGNLNFPNFGLFFNLGLLVERSGLGFGALVLWALARVCRKLFSVVFSLGQFGFRGASAFRFLGPETIKLSHKCRNGLPST